MKIIFVWKDGKETPAKYGVSGDFGDASVAAEEELQNLRDENSLHCYSNLKEIRIVM